MSEISSAVQQPKIITTLSANRGIVLATTMLTELLPVVLIILLLYKFYHFVFDKPAKNVPPGLPRLPIWGSYWFLLWGNYEFPHRTIQYYTKKYKSKVISCWLGDFFAVIATDHKSVNEVLRNKDFDGRVSEAFLPKARAFGKRLGIFFNDGPAWKEQRRFALRYMRDFGFGRRMDKVESDFAEELATVIDILKNGPINDDERSLMKDDGRVFFPDILYPIACNFILAILTGQRELRTDHKKLRGVAKAAAQFQRHTDTTGGAILQTPWLRHIAHGFAFPGYIEGTLGMVEFIRKCFKTYEASFIAEEERGFLDTYIKKLKEDGETSTFSEEQLLMVGTDFILPALSANPWSVTVFIKYMMHYPHVMQKVRNEIDTVVGRDRLITLNDREKLPYTEATIREVMRADSMTPWSIVHRAMEGSQLCGYDIPANTLVITDLHSVHHDPEFWGDPENLRPERFLNEDGSLGKDDTLSFGGGGRLCAGETFARQFQFLLSATMVQHFDFSFVDGEPSGLDDRLPGFATGPKDLWIKVTNRE